MTDAALQVAGGPKIPLRFGRKDADGPESAVPEGNLPGVQSLLDCLSVRGVSVVRRQGRESMRH